jgi:hypothetical protein
MKKLFLHSGKMMIGEFPDVQTNALSALSVLNECEAAVSAAKASAVEVVNGEDALHKINDWFLPLPGGGLGRKLNEGQLCDLPTGWWSMKNNASIKRRTAIAQTVSGDRCVKRSPISFLPPMLPALSTCTTENVGDTETRAYCVRIIVISKRPGLKSAL